MIIEINYNLKKISSIHKTFDLSISFNPFFALYNVQCTANLFTDKYFTKLQLVHIEESMNLVFDFDDVSKLEQVNSS